MIENMIGNVYASVCYLMGSTLDLKLIYYYKIWKKLKNKIKNKIMIICGWDATYYCDIC